MLTLKHNIHYKEFIYLYAEAALRNYEVKLYIIENEVCH